MDQLKTLYTVGHSNHSLEEFVQLLQKNAITVVADVRSQPYSRRTPQFNREALLAGLKACGIQYVFLGEELGARRAEPECYEAERAPYHRIVTLPKFQAGLERLRRGAASQAVAIMCAEKEPLDCHRTILICRQLRHEFRIMHVLAHGEVEVVFVVAAPAKGLVFDNGDGTFTFLPNGEFEDLPVGDSENVTFTYKATDNHGADSITKTVTITVSGANDAPSANDVKASTPNDTTVTADFDGYDGDTGDTLSYSVVAGPSKGTVTNNNDGTFTFDPDGDFDDLSAGQSETVTFTYKATDSHAADSAVRTVSILVKAVPPGLRLNLTVYRPISPPFQTTEVPEETEDTIGAGIRFNGDDDNFNGVGQPRGNGVPDVDEDNVPGDDDLIQLTFDFGATSAPAGVEYVIERSNASVRVWDSTKSGAVLKDNKEKVIPFAPTASLWVEWVNPILGQADAILTFKARDAATKAPLGTPDSVRVFRFTSEVIVIGGRGQVPSDPAPAGDGIFSLAKWLYAGGYDVHVFLESDVTASGRGVAYDEVASAIDDRNVSSIATIGFSWGGGATYALVNRLILDGNRGLFQNPFGVDFTAYIDAIRHQSLRAAETRKPTSSLYHVNYFQTRDMLLQGAAVTGPGVVNVEGI